LLSAETEEEKVTDNDIMLLDRYRLESLKLADAPKGA
jgi:hypothetical protein